LQLFPSIDPIDPMTCTVRTLTSNGPYFPPSVGSYQARCLRDVIFHVWLAMADGDDFIGLFHDDTCVGIFSDEAEPDADGEGDWTLGSPSYVLRRPGDKAPQTFQALAAKLTEAV
jgi:hypothetical protein